MNYRIINSNIVMQMLPGNLPCVPANVIHADHDKALHTDIWRYRGYLDNNPSTKMH